MLKDCDDREERGKVVVFVRCLCEFDGTGVLQLEEKWILKN